jgi:iduronate 2-sulfatase
VATLASTPLDVQKDVVMIAVDDLRSQISCLDAPGSIRPLDVGMHTPNICNLANQSLVLLRSQVAMATCSPSRTALLTSRHISATHVWDLKNYFRDVTGNFTTLPQYFKERGYQTAGMGKIFHPGEASGGTNCSMCTGADDNLYSWTDPYFHGKDPVDDTHPPLTSWAAVPENITSVTPLCDTQVLNHAISTLTNISKARNEAKAAGTAVKPFFVAVGFHKPHLPFVFPERFLDFYPEEDIQLPSNMYAPVDMPAIAWQGFGETRNCADLAKLNVSGEINATGFPDHVVKELRRAYYSAVSYTDFNVGKVLDTLADLKLDPIVAFWGDHG